MPDLEIIRLSTGYINEGIYQVVRDPALPHTAWLVTSDRKCIPVTPESLLASGFWPDRDYIEETKEGFRFFFSDKLSTWSRQSRSSFANGDLQPCTFRQLFNDIRDFFKEFVYLDTEVYYDLISLAVVLTYWIIIPTAVPFFEVLGTVGGGKSTLLYVFATLGRSGMLTSTATLAALARSRFLDFSTFCIDERFRHSNDPSLLCSNKKGATRLVCGPGKQLIVQNIYGPLFKVQDAASEALKDRTISIEIAPCKAPLTPFDAGKQRNRIQELVDRLFWLTLAQFRTFEECLEETYRSIPLSGRAAEKWYALCAVARLIDASDPEEPPIFPGIETFMLESIRLQREERLTTDPQLLILVGLRDYLAQLSLPEGQADAELPIGSFTESLIKQFDISFVPQQVSALLRLHGLIISVRRSRASSIPIANNNGNAKTLVRIDLAKLQTALRNHDLDEATEEKEILS